MERYLRVNLLGPGPRLMKKEFTRPRSHKGLRNTGLENSLSSYINLKVQNSLFQISTIIEILLFR